MKNRVLLENYYRPDVPEAQVVAFMAREDHHCYREGLHNLTLGRLPGRSRLLNPTAREENITPFRPDVQFAEPQKRCLTQRTYGVKLPLSLRFF